MSNTHSPTPRAMLYRMVLTDHVCPYGLRALSMLEQAGFEIDDRPLESREETDAFMAEHDLRTTPLVIIDDQTIGGSDDLERWLRAGH